jgi:hypothetical protein
LPSAQPKQTKATCLLLNLNKLKPLAFCST